MLCINHPDKEAIAYCAKNDKYFCEECLRCEGPNIYCKFRKQCMVWELQRHGNGVEIKHEGDGRQSEAVDK